MLLKIESWSGRLGNNIIQLKNVISIGVYYGYDIILPNHLYFNKVFIKINKNNKTNDKNDVIFVDCQGSNFFLSKQNNSI